MKHISPELAKIQAQALSAADYLAQTFQQATDCSIIALGPLTNIALALKRTSSGAKSSTFLSQWVVPLKATAIALLLQNLIIGVILMQQLGFFEKLGYKKIEMVGLDVTREIVFTPTILNYCQRLNPQNGELPR